MVSAVGYKQRWFMVGKFSDRTIRDLKEIVRLERVTGAPERANSAPVGTADLGDPQGKGVGGTEEIVGKAGTEPR